MNEYNRKDFIADTAQKIFMNQNFILGKENIVADACVVMAVALADALENKFVKDSL